MDISNGPGVRVSVFMQGCTFNCKNCFNKETHDFNGGKEFTDEIIDKVLELCGKDYIVGLSILVFSANDLKPDVRISFKYITFRSFL